jgi:HPt (histidine-containing phosphotransfer) domain-containing protein
MKSIAALEEFVCLPELMDRVENDEELLVELFVLFREDLPQSRAALQHAAARGDLHEIEQAAHKLKGMLANLAAKAAAAQAAEIESAARAGNGEKIPELTLSFDHRITTLSAALDAFTASV